MPTPHHATYLAHRLAATGTAGDIDALSRSISRSRVDLNPHQVDAALAALHSPLSKGIILADEVGLGKTIEAGIVMTQGWAEGGAVCCSSCRPLCASSGRPSSRRSSDCRR